MARKSRAKILKDIAPEGKMSCGYLSIPLGDKEEVTVLAGEYGRISVEDGDDIEQNSIGNQQKITLHYLEEHSDIKLVDTYYDNGYTGMNYDRPGFIRMLGDLKSGRIN